MSDPIEQPTVKNPDEEIDWAAEAAEDDTAAEKIGGKLQDMEIPVAAIKAVEQALQTDSNRVIGVPGTEYRVVRGIGHQLILTSFNNGKNETIFVTGDTDLESDTPATEDDSLKAA